MLVLLLKVLQELELLVKEVRLEVVKIGNKVYELNKMNCPFRGKSIMGDYDFQQVDPFIYLGSCFQKHVILDPQKKSLLYSFVHTKIKVGPQEIID